MVKILGFVGHLVAHISTQFCHCRLKAAIGDTQTNRYSNKALFTEDGHQVEFGPLVIVCQPLL